MSISNAHFARVMKLRRLIEMFGHASRKERLSGEWCLRNCAYRSLASTNKMRRSCDIVREYSFMSACGRSRTGDRHVHSRNGVGRRGMNVWKTRLARRERWNSPPSATAPCLFEHLSYPEECVFRHRSRQYVKNVYEVLPPEADRGFLPYQSSWRRARAWNADMAYLSMAESLSAHSARRFIVFYLPACQGLSMLSQTPASKRGERATLHSDRRRPFYHDDRAISSEPRWRCMLEAIDCMCEDEICDTP